MSNRARDLEILRARAKVLAQTPSTSIDSLDRLDVIHFLLASEKYAIESKFVSEVRTLHDFTVLPGAPTFLSGVTSVRGQLVSIIDLRKFFDLPEKNDLNDLNKLIILRGDGFEIGLVADSVIGIGSVAASRLQTSVSTFKGRRGDYIRGITEGRDIVLDAHRILTDKKLIVEDHA